MKPFWIAALIAIFLSLPIAGAIQAPDVTFIPSQISVNSGFLMIVDPHAELEESVGLSWILGTENISGGFQKLENKRIWVCYFSDADPQSTCGPNRFPSPSSGVPYTVLVTAFNQFNNSESTLLNVSVGGIVVDPEITKEGNNVYIYVPGKKDIKIVYNVYSADTLDLIQGKGGTLSYRPSNYGYVANLTLLDGNYYLAFKANYSTSDFGGGVAKISVGNIGPVASGVRVDDIIFGAGTYAGVDVINEKFTITNLQNNVLNNLAIEIPDELSGILKIEPERTTLQPNESMKMIVTLSNIKETTHISIFATLMSGSVELKQIPVEIRVTVLPGPPPEFCLGKPDIQTCPGGKCCSEVCITGDVECCRTTGCSTGQTCSSNHKCSSTVIPGECEGKDDMSYCSAGICCSETCVSGWCCSDEDCDQAAGETCTSNNICEPPVIPDECEDKDNLAECTDGKCCSQSCITGDVECCTDDDCTGEETCSFENKCEPPEQPAPEFDITTIAIIGGAVAAAAVAAFFLLKKFRKKGEEGEEEFEEGGEEKEGDEFSDEDFY